MGAVADRAKAYIPFTWDGLLGDARYGEEALQGRVERAKYEVLGPTAPSEAAEISIPENTLEHIAKRTVVKIIPAGIEFWINQPITRSLTGTNEAVTYESRIAALRALLADLQTEISLEEPIVTPILQTTGFIGVSDGQDDVLITEDPFTFPRTFG